jgi:hypothetical protein
MINFTLYIGEPVVLATNDTRTVEELSGIRVEYGDIFKYDGRYVIARPLTARDLKDPDYVDWLNSMWHHDEKNIRKFLQYKRKYEEKNEQQQIVQEGSTGQNRSPRSS